MTLPQNTSQYKDKRIAVVGLSVEGMDSVAFFANHGAQVFCLDRRSKEDLGNNYNTLSAYTNSFVLGEHYLSELQQYDLIVRSPGIALRTQELVEAKQRGQQVTSLTKLFFAHCRAPIIGVTGTKGKGTTSSLIYAMIKQSGKTVWLGGNIGAPLLSKVDTIAPNDLVVLELSSFQLEDLDMSPHIAVALKITQEHLANFDPHATNYHESREAYVKAKQTIVSYQSESDYVVCTPDDETSNMFGQSTKAKRYTFSRIDEQANAYVKDATVFLRDGEKVHQLCSLETVKVRGIHNLENIAAAAIASHLAGVDVESIRMAAESFEGLEHRLEVVKTVNDVLFINDSFSTVPETTIAAVAAFTEPIVLIVGGSDKGSDYTELGKQIAASSVRVLIIIGAMAQNILAAVKAANYSGEIIMGLKTMNEVVLSAYRNAVAGNVVLLSPACASFDMFQNYKVRGKEFKHEVEVLA